MTSAGTTREPCLVCGEETAVGSAFYSDRRVVDGSDGSRTFVCTSCVQRAVARRHGRRLTDEELRDMVDNGSMAAITWGNAGLGPGI
jgi:hypothetical protein